MQLKKIFTTFKIANDKPTILLHEAATPEKTAYKFTPPVYLALRKTIFYCSISIILCTISVPANIKDFIGSPVQPPPLIKFFGHFSYHL